MSGTKHLTDLFKRLAAVVILLALLMAPAGAVLAAGPAASRDPGAVYTMTNAANGNEVLMFARNPGGSLEPAGAYATGGLGSGAGLGSQGALVLSQDNRWLLVVNAGSSEISVFAVLPGGLQLADKVASGGSTPISVTVHRNQVYVLNAGDGGNITGFKLGSRGALRAIPGSTRYLSNAGVGDAPGPAQISFSPDGQTLVVTEKASNQILTYHLDKRIFDGPVLHASAGETPFGFAFAKRSTLIVSEAFGGAPGASTASSYNVAGHEVQLLDGPEPTFQTAACWVAVSKNGKYAYTTNTGSSSITGYRIGDSGELTLLNADGFTASTGDGSRPIDMAFSSNGRFLYAISGGSSTISGFVFRADGSLMPLGAVDVPPGSLGLAAH